MNEENTEIKMNWAELFTMMYFVFDAIYDGLPEEKKLPPLEDQQNNLGDYIMEIDPINNFWAEYCSSDPAYFQEFCEFMKDKSIGEDYGYSLICEYLKTEEYYHNVLEYFKSYNKDDYIAGCKEFLSQEDHKGKDWKPKEKKVKKTKK